MTPDIGELFTDVIAKLQRNTFRCNNCEHEITFTGSKFSPVFPCDHCGKIDWRVHAINDTIIYKK